MSSTVEKIKERLGVAEVVGRYLKLERAGVNFRARCPFHQEKTPSFFVSPVRGSWHCFGCNRGGDIISFVEEIEGVDFLGALKILAPLAGVEIAAYQPGEANARGRLLAVIDASAHFFTAALKAETEAMSYLRQRGLTEETINAFRLGWAPARWRHAADELNRQGFNDELLVQAGLLVKPTSGAGAKGGRGYERFRGRIIFPLFDAAGRPAGFSGRRLADQTEEAKYINTPETLVYQKSKLLYGFDRAKTAIREAGEVILVEGQMDLLLAHQSGCTNAVAVSGTALSTDHLQQLSRLTDRVVMSFDQDPAGIKAARRAIELALGLGLEVRAAVLPVGLDPADVIKDDPAKFKSAVAEAKHVIDFFLVTLLGRPVASQELNRLVTAEILPYVRRLPNALDQAHFVKKIANLLNVAEEPVWLELKKSASIPLTGRPAVPAPSSPPSRLEKIERLLFGLRLASEELSFNHDRLTAKLQALLSPAEWTEKVSHYNQSGDDLLFEIELTYAGREKLDELIGELLADYERERLKQDLTATLALLRRAEAADDRAAIDSYTKKCQDISQALNNINHP